MKKAGYILFALVVLLISLFANFDGMKLTPGVTEEEFLSSQPYITIGNVILTQPSSTVIVYALGVFIILLGVRFLKKKQGYNSRKWGSLNDILGSGSHFCRDKLSGVWG